MTSVVHLFVYFLNFLQLLPVTGYRVERRRDIGQEGGKTKREKRGKKA
jgi:hypothetical protein